jgi:DHA3 family tetracycline resistance protein-like MFS transporter
MALLFDPVLSVIAFILTDSLGNMRDPIFTDYLNRHIESRNRATVISTIFVADSLYSLVARPVFGGLADMDLRYAFVAIGAVTLMGAIVFRIRGDDVISS